MKATIVNFTPWELKESKPGVIPGDFTIPKKEKDLPGVLVVEDARSNIYMGMDRPPFPSTVSVETLANSIVNDCIGGSLEVEADAKPGIFWVEGSFTPEEIVKNFADKVKEAKASQMRWFGKLVKIADDLWARFRQHKMITDLQRHAAKELGLNGKEWAIEPEAISLLKCPACKTMIESDALVCSNCRAILKPEEAKKAGINFAA